MVFSWYYYTPSSFRDDEFMIGAVSLCKSNRGPIGTKLNAAQYVARVRQTESRQTSLEEHSF